MSMRLYMVPLAPNPTKVMLYLAEREQLGADLPVEQVMVNTLKGKHREPAHLARNPFGTLPVLELDDGTYLIESLAIMEYLEDAYPDGALRPGDALARARARDLERVVDQRIGVPIAAYVHATKSPIGWDPEPEVAAKMVEAVQIPLNHIEGLLADGRRFLNGERVDIADCTLAAGMQFLRFIEEDLMGDRPNLRAWDARYRARPAAQAVLKW